MKSSWTICRRKATWLAFGLVALALTSSAHQSPQNDPTAEPSVIPEVNEVPIAADAVHSEAFDQAAEASRAYKHAMHTLSSLTAISTSHPQEASFVSGYTDPSSSILSSLLPWLERAGPLGPVVRAVEDVQDKFSEIMSTLTSGPITSKRHDKELFRKAVKVVDLLQHSAELGNTDALYSLAQISLFPPTDQFPFDPRLAYTSLDTHATQTGNASSQALLAFFHSTGYQDVVPVNQPLAQLYYTFAANGGDKGSQMALAYRYWSGIGTLEDCGRASDWYEQASEQAMAKFLTGPPGGRTLPPTHTRLSDIEGGIFGPGASVASTGLNAHRAAIKAGLSRESGETWADILDFYLFNAARGETGFAYRLGKIYYQGSIYAAPGGIASGSEGVGAIQQDYLEALKYFMQIARQVWPKDPSNPLSYRPAPRNKGENLPVGYAAASAGYIGRMYLRGEGVKANAAIAKMWFERGVEYGDRECHNGLGIIYRDGLIKGLKPDVVKAANHFGKAAGQELAEAQVNLAKIHYERGDTGKATIYFDTAARLGSPLEAYYYLGQIYSAQAVMLGIPQNFVASSCAMAVSFFKNVAERGVWDDNLMQEAETAWVSGSQRERQIAVLKWWIAAERGWEIAQNNLGHILDQDKTVLRVAEGALPVSPTNNTAQLALTQWTRAAAQRNIDALVKVGDYYYHGLGVTPSESHTRYEKAARYYQSAADTQMSALAMWNLGWMYENGLGVQQDFHLAKRHYDLALEINAEAYLPVFLSLSKLYLRSIWHMLRGHSDGLNLWAIDEKHESASIVEKTEPAPKGRLDAPLESQPEQPQFDDDEGDSTWYLGKAKDEFHRRQQSIQDENEDPIQWAREQRRAEQEIENEFGPDDYFDGALRGGHREEGVEDEFSETMLLVVLCLTVTFLIYMRTRIIDRLRRNQRQQQRQPTEDVPAPPQNGGIHQAAVGHTTRGNAPPEST